MLRKGSLLSLLLVIIMMCAAAITVDKEVLRHKIEPYEQKEDNSEKIADPINILPDGTTVINTSVLKGTIDGYAGPVPLEIYIKDGVITDIAPLPNAETPGFFSRASKILNSWNGKTTDESLGMKVDAVSGATLSSNAIINNVQKGLAYYEGVKATPKSSVPIKIWIALAVTLAACIVPLFVKNRLYHNVQMIANVIVLGFWCGTFLDYALMLKYISSGITLPAGLVAIAMLIAAFVYPLFGRPQHYCNHICPLGSAQQLAGQICGYKIKISKKLLHGLDWFRRILWAILMLSLWTDCLTGWMDLELFQAFMFESASWWIIGIALVFIALSVIVNRPYCRFVCPTGSLFKRAENIG